MPSDASMIENLYYLNQYWNITNWNYRNKIIYIFTKYN